MIKPVRKIFIVDDDELLSIALEDYLHRKTRHDVAVFSTGEECLAQLHRGPDIVILDYNLNSVSRHAENGLKILEHIKKEDNTIRVIMLSSQEAYGKAMQTMREGAEEYVIKAEDAFERIAALCNSA